MNYNTFGFPLIFIYLLDLTHSSMSALLLWGMVADASLQFKELLSTASHIH